MQYLMRKITFLLYEYYYDKNNGKLEKDLCNVIHELEKRNWNPVKCDFEKSIKILQGIKPKYNLKPYAWIKSANDFIGYLEYLPVEIGENQAERAIAYSEALGDYIYENGYDTFMQEGF